MFCYTAIKLKSVYVIERIDVHEVITWSKKSTNERENKDMKKTEQKEKNVNKIMLKKEFAKYYRMSKIDASKYDINLSDLTQAQACDILITSMLTTSKSYKDVVKDVLQFIDDNDISMKNYNNNKNLIKKRLLRHMTSDTIERLSKRLTTI